MIRTLALRVLREILSKQPWRFKNYAELTIMKALESHKDPHKEVRLSTPTLICSLRSWFYHKALSDHEAVVQNTPFFIYGSSKLEKSFVIITWSCCIFIFLCFSVGGSSSWGDSSHVGVVHQSRPVYQGVVSHYPVSWLPNQPGRHQDADQSSGEDSPRRPD